MVDMVARHVVSVRQTAQPYDEHHKLHLHIEFWKIPGIAVCLSHQPVLLSRNRPRRTRCYELFTLEEKALHTCVKYYIVLVGSGLSLFSNASSLGNVVEVERYL